MTGSHRRTHVMVVVGTRPEAIKMGPVIHELRRQSQEFSTFVCATGQHKELLTRALEISGVEPDGNLDVMMADQPLAGLTARLLERLDPVIVDQQPDWLLVQGDTTTALAGALAAFYRRVRVGHVEAGLRTGDLAHPFPEELNRQIADRCADLCFAPTDDARANLIREGIPADRIHVTGNTIVDAVEAIARQPYDRSRTVLAGVPDETRWILVTAHRRENFGERLEEIVSAVRELAVRCGTGAHLIVPVHPNPQAAAAMDRLRDLDNCSVVAPLDYADLLHVLSRAALVLTDSGGIQEEAPTFGVPVLVLRDKTERPEGVAAGVARLVGTDPDRILREATRILAVPRLPAPPVNPYGDGRAAQRIVAILAAVAAGPAILADDGAVRPDEQATIAGEITHSR
jgi:UDP-N-acetylglucosamine 2-epimerase (non-hydrolysing)